MGRGKSDMKFIMKDKVRISTYEKRKKSLMKKAKEFSILCSVETCVIIYGPRSKDTPPKLEIWPPDHAEVMNVIDKYKGNPLHVRERKRLNMLDFFATRQKKLDDEINKLRKAYVEAKFSTWDDRIDKFSMDQLSALLVKLDSNMESANKRIKMIKGKRQSLIEDSKSVMFQKNLNMEIVTKQQQQQQQQHMFNVPSYHPFRFNEALQWQNLNLNHIDNSMAMVSKNAAFDFTRVNGECSKSVTHSHGSLSPQACYDPGAPILVDNVMSNNSWGVPICFYGQFMQPMTTPFVQPTTSSFPTQFGHLYSNIGDWSNRSMNRTGWF